MAEWQDAPLADAAPSWRDAPLADETTLRTSLTAALGSNPDQFARSLDIAKQAGIPADVVERNFARVDPVVRAKEFNDILRSAPRLRSMMAEPEFAKLAHDDLDNATTLEQLLQRQRAEAGTHHAPDKRPPPSMLERSVRNVAAAVPNVSVGGYGLLQAGSEMLWHGFDLLGEIGLIPANPMGGVPPFFERERRNSERVAEQWAGDLSNAGPVERGFYSGLQSMSQNLPIVLAAAYTAQPELVSLTSMSALTGGQSYGEARDAGIDPASAMTYAISNATVEAATERIPVGKLFKDLAADSGLMKTLLNQIIAEVPTEQLATLAQDLNQWAVLNPDKPFSTYLEARPGAAAETLIATLIATGAQTGGIVGLRELTRQDDRASAQLADANAKRLADIVQLATDSKLRERAPDAFERFVQHASQDGDLTEVYVDARALGEVLEQAGVTPQDASPSIAAQMGEALAVGGDVRIPVGEFAARVATAEYAPNLMPHLRTSAEAMSQAEAETFNQQGAAEFKQQAEQLIAEQAEDDAYQQSVLNVEGILREQLTKANRFTPDVNNAYAALMRDFYVTTADKLGVTPEEMYAQYPLRVTAENIAGAQMDQLPAEQFEVDENSLGQYRINAGTQANGEPVAFMDLEDMDDGTLQIKLAEVDEERRGEGIGQQLLQKAYEVAQSRGKRLLSDVAVSTKQLRAYEALRRKGWTIEYADPAAVTRALGGSDDEGVSTMPLDSFEARGPVVTRIEPPAELQQSAIPQTDTPEFQAWFGDSKVVDKNGKPLVVYHGTNANFKKFNKNKTTQGIFWVTSNRAAVEAGEVGAQGRGRIMELYASIQKPATWEDYEKLSLGELKARGFDGAILDDGDGQFTAFVFEPSQLKSAVGNSGAFDPTNASILEQSGANRDLIDDNATGLTELLQGQTSAPRGQIALDGKGGATISLLQNADLSTFLHESGHFFLEVYADLAAQNAPIAADFNALLKWFGVESAQQWQGMTLEERRPHHEKFARGFEAYLFEGKAPTAELTSLFSKFRSWLMNVYQTLTQLNVELTDEVRAVFGRMLASEAAISAVEAARQAAPMFTSAAEASMTQDEWQAYVATNDAAHERAVNELAGRSLRDMQWASRARNRELKRLQADAASKRKAVRDEAESDVRAEPVYQALRFLTTGEVTTELGEVLKTDAPHRFDRETIEKANYGDIQMQRLEPFLRKDGVPPDHIAEMFGFTSGDHLVRAITDAPKLEDAIEAETDKRTLERYGDIGNITDMERAADQAVHNEARLKFVATELRALDRMMSGQAKTPRGGSVNVNTQVAKTFAATLIARRKIRDLKTAQFAAAEARAAKNATAELAAGNLPGAAIEKRNQLVNGYAVSAAYDAQNEIDRALTYLRKFDNDATRGKLDGDYLEQIDKFLERFDLRRRTASARELAKRQALLKWVDAQRALGFEPEIDESLLNEASRTPYRELTVERFRGLVDTVRNIEHLGRLKHRLLVGQEQRELAAAVDSAVAVVEDNARSDVQEKLERNTLFDQMKDVTAGFFASHRKFASIIRQMSGAKDGGALWDLLVRPLNEASTKEARMRADATAALTKLFKPVLKLGPLNGDKRVIKQIGRSMTREGRLAVALNQGTETNKLRVVEGDKWSPSQVQAILDMLSKEEWDFVQGVWDYIGSYWPEIAAKQKRVTGITQEKVEPTPVRTKHGEYRGGYYPIKYDAARSSRSEADIDAEAIRQTMQGLYTRATTRRGHTKARVESVQRPMRKDLGVIFEHLTEVTHDLAFHETLVDTNRILRSTKLDSSIRSHYGPQYVRQLRDTLDAVAKGEIPAQRAIDRAINYLRTGTTVAGLGWNLTTALLQPLGLTQSMVRIGPAYVARGIAQWLGSPAHMQETVKHIYDKSDMMRLRGQTMQREISELRSRIHGGEKLSNLQASFFYLIQQMQKVADVPTWLGAYEKAIDTGSDDKEAVALADQAVLDAQGGGQIKDLAEIQRGGSFYKLWTNFYSFFNTTYNLMAESAHRTDFKKPGDVGRLAVDFALLYIIPATLGSLLHMAMNGDDDDDWAEKLVRDNLSYLLGSMVLLRELGQAMSGYDYKGPAGGRFFSEMAKLQKQSEQGELDAALLHAFLNTAGVLFHIPSGQLWRTGAGIHALATGETSNPAALITGP